MSRWVHSEMGVEYEFFNFHHRPSKRRYTKNLKSSKEVEGKQMKIAMLLGSSIYKNMNVQNLPACYNDIEVMKNLLEATNNFRDIKVFVADKLDTSSIKNEIITWLEKYEAQDIDELFFYYTGHGMVRNDEFYYALADHNQEKFHQTTIANKFLDDLLRESNAKLTVKVIDACHSGTAYVKSLEDTVKKNFDQSSRNFNKCIFMFSSASTQSSFQDKNSLSFFTKAFVDAIKNSKKDIIRYREIQEYIADQFPKTFDGYIQQPFFVSQSKNTEFFTSMNDALSLVEYPEGNIISPESQAIVDTGGVVTDNVSSIEVLAQLAKKSASENIGEEEATEILVNIKDAILNYSFSADFNALYTIENEIFDSTQSIPMRKAIGEWILENDVDEYFVEASYRRQYSNKFLTPLEQFARDINGEPSDYDLVLDGFKYTVETPYSGLKYIIRRKFNSIPNQGFILTYFLSKQGIQLFYFQTTYTMTNWNSMKLNTEWVDWEREFIKFEDTQTILTRIQKIMSELDIYVVNSAKNALNFEA